MLEYFKALPAWQRYTAYLVALVVLGLLLYFGKDTLSPLNQ